MSNKDKIIDSLLEDRFFLIHPWIKKCSKSEESKEELSRLLCSYKKAYKTAMKL